MKHGLLAALGAVLAAAVAAPAGADVTLPHIFGSHMVLQRDREVPVWGWADAEEKVSVKIGDKPAVAATANAKGEWRLSLPAMPAGGPFTLTVAGKNTLALEDVLVGEVWLCSGQSNMEMVVRSCNDFEKEIAGAAVFPQIRHIKVPRVPKSLPEKDFQGQWEVCGADTAGNFTAAGYFMARELYKELKVPIGLVNSSWGGTRIEPWTPPVGWEGLEALESIHKSVLLADPRTPLYKETLGKYLDALDGWSKGAREAMAQEKMVTPAPAYPADLVAMGERPNPHGLPGTLYNGMIHPLVPFALRGAIWYQGESNHGEGMLYTEKTKALVAGWRKVWGQGDFPFYYVQIAPYRYGEEDPYRVATFWEAQAAALSIPNTGMVVTTDIGNVNDIHPKNKQDVGRRLALLARAKDYGRKNLVCSGPTFKELALEGDKLRVRFENVGGGLASRDGKPLTHFEVIGEDTDFVAAQAAIEGDAVVLSSDKVKKPLAMRFSWHRNAEPNLMNKEGLPASAFRAGKVPERDFMALNVAESKEFELVYALDLAKAGANIVYDTDRRAQIIKPFDRVAYFLELQKAGEPVRWVYVSMDAFTDDLGKIGVPTVASKAKFQRKVAHMNVLSNAEGITAGTDLAGGNIEFWPHNYGPLNGIGIANASAELWDFGDQPSDPEDGYGSMQVHNAEAKQTLFAINGWKNGPNANIGIGNSTVDARTRDWTFVSNASSYTLKKLRVLVRPKQ